MSHQTQTITTTRIGDACCIHIVPESLHEVDLSPLERDILDTARQVDARCFVIDFGGVSYIPTTVLGVLLKCQRHIESGGGRLHLAGMAQRIQQVFIVSDLIRVLAIYDTVDEAIEAFAEPR